MAPQPQKSAIEMDQALAVFVAVKRAHPEAFFFETAGIDDRKKKLSIIGLGPFETIRRDAEGKLARAVAGKFTAETGSFFEALGELSSRVGGDGAVPFARGGLFGCLGFDCIRDLEPTVTATGEPTGEVTAEVMLARNLIVYDHARGEVSFRGEKTAEVYKQVSGDLPARRSAPRADEISSDRLTASLGFANFRERVLTLREHIRAGDIFQAVLAERFECTTKASSLEIFRELYELNPAAYSFFFSLSHGDFLGASPEALLKAEGGRIITHPIAGTRPRGETQEKDQALAKNLRASRKENAEHLMLVDLARNDLGRVAKPGTVKVNFFSEIKKFANVMHLVSEVEAQLETSRTPLGALAACFPAGTLSGAPKIRAMQLLSRLEKKNRGLYGGAVLAFDPSAGMLDSCIAIRCLEKVGDLVILRAGAGIVADSKPDFEYAEISHKLRSIRQALQAAETRAGLK